MRVIHLGRQKDDFVYLRADAKLGKHVGDMTLRMADVKLADGSPVLKWDPDTKRLREAHLDPRGSVTSRVVKQDHTRVELFVTVLASRLPRSSSYGGSPFFLTLDLSARTRDGLVQVEATTEVFRTTARAKRQCPLVFGTPRKRPRPRFHGREKGEEENQPPGKGRLEELTRESVMFAFGARELRQMAEELEHEGMERVDYGLTGVVGYGCDYRYAKDCLG